MEFLYYGYRSRSKQMQPIACDLVVQHIFLKHYCNYSKTDCLLLNKNKFQISPRNPNKNAKVY